MNTNKMQQEVTQQQFENSPTNVLRQYLDEEKERHQSPIHKSGLELMSSIANITSCAILISKENLNHTPRIFEECGFEQKREKLKELDEDKQTVEMDKLSLVLTREYKEVLAEEIISFLNDFYTDNTNIKVRSKPSNLFKKSRLSQTEKVPNTYNIKRIPYKYIVDRRKKEQGEYLEKDLNDLLGEEISIKKTYELYKDLALFLKYSGMQLRTFEKMLFLSEKENRVRYTTH